MFTLSGALVHRSWGLRNSDNMWLDVTTQAVCVQVFLRTNTDTVSSAVGS